MSSKVRLVLVNAVLWAATVVGAAIILSGSGHSTRPIPFLATAGMVTLLLNLRTVCR